MMLIFIGLEFDHLISLDCCCPFSWKTEDFLPLLVCPELLSKRGWEEKRRCYDDDMRLCKSQFDPT